MTFFIYTQNHNLHHKEWIESKLVVRWDRAHTADQRSRNSHVSSALFFASSVDPYSSFDKFSSRATSNTCQSLQIPSDMQSQPQNRTTTRVLSSVLLKKSCWKGVPFRRKESEKKLNKEENRRTRRKNFFAVKTLHINNKQRKKDAKIAEKLSDWRLMWERSLKHGHVRSKFISCPLVVALETD